MHRFPGATWTSAHVYGEGEKNIARGLTYYHTPKCASMWMRAYLAQLGQNHARDRWEPTVFVHEPLDHYRKIVIVRDPVSRWLSVCPARDIIETVSRDLYSVQALFADLSSWLLDEHLAPQMHFIQGLDLTHAVWFNCDMDLSGAMQTFFQQQDFRDYQAPPIINQQAQDAATQRARQIWHELLTTPEYFASFQLAYHDDYLMLDSIKYYDCHS